MVLSPWWTPPGVMLRSVFASSGALASRTAELSATAMSARRVAVIQRNRLGCAEPGGPVGRLLQGPR